MLEQILSSSTIRNVWRTVWRRSMFMLGLKGLIHLRDKAFIPQDKTLASREDVNLFLSSIVPTQYSQGSWNGLPTNTVHRRTCVCTSIHSSYHSDAKGVVCEDPYITRGLRQQSQYGPTGCGPFHVRSRISLNDTGELNRWVLCDYFVWWSCYKAGIT